MISIDFYSELLPLTCDIFRISEDDARPAFSNETLSWFEENNMKVFMEGTHIWYDTGGAQFSTYRKPISEMTLGLYANTSCSHCKLVFENNDDLILFKLTWV